MINTSFFNTVLIIWLSLAIIIFLILIVLKIKVPYGRYTRKGWGKFIGNRAGWVIMELPALFIFILLFFVYNNKHNAIVWFIFAVWIFHYSYRSLIYPFRIRSISKQMPLSVMFMGFFFNIINTFLIGYYFSFIKPVYPYDWIWDPRFIIGILLFISGIIINWQADNKLIHLKINNGNSYFIPYGGLYRYISCPNYFGEILEWLGFAIMTWNLPAFAFAIWTIANLAPRAFLHHKWYLDKFNNYPKDRKALIPYII